MASNQRSILILALSTLFALHAAVAHAQDISATVTRWDNQELDGSFRGFTDDGRSVRMQQNGSIRTIPINELLKIQFQQSGFSSNLPTRLDLRGGGQLQGELMDGGNQSAIRLSSPVLSSETNVRLTWMKRIAFTDRTEEETASAEAEQNDLLFDTSGDRYQGVLSAVSTTNILFEDENLGEKTFSLEQVREVLLAPIGSPPSRPGEVFLEIYGAGGSVLPGIPSSYSDHELLLSGLMEGSEWTVDLNNVRTILVRNGKVRYVSEMDPVEVVQKEVFPWQTDPSKGDKLPDAFHWRRDQSVPDRPGQHDPLTLNDTVYEKGIGATSYTKLTYELDGSYSRFQATIGLDDRADHPEHRGAATFRLLVDGEERFSSGTISTAEDPQSINVDVSGASTMSLVVDLETGYLDYANWAGARLIRNE